MMKKLTALFLALMLSLSVSLPALALDKAGDKASEMDLYTLDGEKVTLTSFFGKPIVINFWATWCPWCVYEFPEFEKMYQEYGDRIQFMVVDLCDGSYETEEKAAAFIAENGYTFPVFIAKTDYAYYNFGYQGIPASVFIASDGVIVSDHLGAYTDGEELRAALESILPAE